MDNGMETQQFNAPTLRGQGGMMEVAQSRAAQETQAAMVVAQRFPRNEEAAFARILQACKRKSLAETAVYVYPRGGQSVTGPSIRLAETLAKNWGNLDFGTVELERKAGTGNAPSESTMMTYCWDLETNVRQTKIFTVKHKRDTRKGSYALDDERDIYELTANQAARRLRSCILGVIPGDIVEAAVGQCEKTMSGGQGPLIDRVRAMAMAFQERFTVDVAMIEKRLGHKLDATSEAELVKLRGIFQALQDNQSSREDYFDIAATETAQASELNARVAPVATAPVQPAAPAPAPAVAAPATAKPPKPAPKKKVEVPTQPAPAPFPTPDPNEEAPGDFQNFQGGSLAQTGTVTAPAPVEKPWIDPEIEAAQKKIDAARAQQQAAPAPVAPILQAVPTAAYVFDFGSHTGKTPESLGMELMSNYIGRLKAAPVKDDKINRAIVAVEAYLKSGEGA